MRSSLVPHACSPINVPQDHDMHLHGSTASEKAICKSRPGHLLPSTWCFWVVHECMYTFHLLTKTGFQLMCG